MSRILWLTPQKGYTDKQKFSMEQTIKRAGLKTANIFYHNPHRGNPDLIAFKNKKEILNRVNSGNLVNNLSVACLTFKPSIIVCNDIASLGLITGKDYSLNLCRGSVYMYDGIPCIPVDQLSNLYNLNYGPWLFLNDCQKIKRWVNGEQRHEPRFQYTVCRTAAAVKNAADILEMADAISTDCETRNGYITSISYTAAIRDVLQTWVVPFYNPTQENNCHYSSEREEVEVWLHIRRIHANSAIKILQNGSYDCVYCIRYRVPLINYFC